MTSNVLSLPNFKFATLLGCVGAGGQGAAVALRHPVALHRAPAVKQGQGSTR